MLNRYGILGQSTSCSISKKGLYTDGNKDVVINLVETPKYLNDFCGLGELGIG